MRLGCRCFGRLLTAFKFVHPALQCVYLPHQLLDGGLLRQGRSRQYCSAQDTANKTETAHVFPRNQPAARITSSTSKHPSDGRARSTSPAGSRVTLYRHYILAEAVNDCSELRKEL